MTKARQAMQKAREDKDRAAARTASQQVQEQERALQQLLSHYSRTDKNPDGVSLDEAFPLPARIRQIEVGQGQAVIIQ